jgi:hypothetical protein
MNKRHRKITKKKIAAFAKARLLGEPYEGPKITRRERKGFWQKNSK